MRRDRQVPEWLWVAMILVSLYLLASLPGCGSTGGGGNPPPPPPAGIVVSWAPGCGPRPADADARALASIHNPRHQEECNRDALAWNLVVRVQKLGSAYGYYCPAGARGGPCSGALELVVACNLGRPWYENIPWEARNHCCALTGTCVPR